MLACARDGHYRVRRASHALENVLTRRRLWDVLGKGEVHRIEDYAAAHWVSRASRVIASH